MLLELTSVRAKASGDLCGRVGTRDVVDASVQSVTGRHGTVVATGDSADLRQQLDPTVTIIEI